MRELKVAVVQMRPELAKMEENVGKMSETMLESLRSSLLM